ncbi:patatin-like phospholipase family protein [Mucisphaera calidilacus]|uniref:Patatin-like phospholipase n=1 Tax=Mucisphaera calidilacus TaxID=2527982 RepID=A0A518BZR2_9BACT|nr:patatin-like phospholipase family protein [Mucisphaera calidilacus]QDU72467.1 Patatin-like phospholipase [Mucisphaera calidilacus]
MMPTHTIKMLVLLLMVLAPLQGCVQQRQRPVRSEADLIQAAEAFQAEYVAGRYEALQVLIARMEKELDDYQQGHTDEPPVLDLLTISGGGDHGAFGSALLDAWGDVPPGTTGIIPRPEFDIVSGISTGSLIACSVFAGSDEAYELCARTYQEATPDWVSGRGLSGLLPSSDALVDTTILEEEIYKQLSDELIRQIAEGRADHRLMVVGSADLDLARMRMWDVGRIAQQAVDTGDYDTFREIVMSSASIPIAFPPKIIDDALYVDGGVIGNLLGGRDPIWFLRLVRMWKARHPDQPCPKIRIWALVNNKERLEPRYTELRWPDIAARSISAALHAGTMQTLQQLWLMSELTREREGVEIEYRWTAIPQDTYLPDAYDMFAPSTLETLSALGARMAGDPNTWQTLPPALD